MANLEIRIKMQKADVRQWEVADGMGVSEFTLTRWLRKELSEERKAAVLDAVHRLIAQKKAHIKR